MNAPQMSVVTTAGAIGERWLGIPGIEVTPGGRIFASFFSGGVAEPDPGNTVYLAWSDNGGATFTPPTAMALPHAGTRCFDPTLWLAPTGALWLIYNRGNRDTAQHAVFARTCAKPDGRVPTWSAEFPVPLETPYAFRMNKPTVLSTGEWVMPVTHARQPVYDWFAGPAQVQGVAISSDEGRNWSLHGAVEAPHWALENMVAERRDGSLVMLIRAGGGFLWESRSFDRGRTWTAGRPSTIPNPGSRFFVRVLDDGRWLLLNHVSPDERTGLAAWLSMNEGETWGAGLVIDGRAGISYPDAVVAPDGTVLSVHDRDRGGAAEVLLARFHLNDIPG